MHKIFLFICFSFFNSILKSSQKVHNNFTPQVSKRSYRNKLSFRNKLNLLEKKNIESIGQQSKNVINVTKKITLDFEVLIERISKDSLLKADFLKEDSSKSITNSLNRSIKKISEMNNI